MNIKEFEKSVEQNEPPKNINDYLTALWHDKKGNWDRAHDIVQLLNDSNGDWIHAYLHRKEGDNYNAAYWYRKSGNSKPGISFEEEWENLVNQFLENY